MPIWIYVLIAFLILTFFLAFFAFLSQKRAKGFTSSQQKYILKHWDRIVDIADSDPKTAVLDADKLLDYALDCKGFSGSLGEKLKKAGPRFSDLSGIWVAHKLRNKIAHELSDIKIVEVKSALRAFKHALNDLGAKL